MRRCGARITAVRVGGIAASTRLSNARPQFQATADFALLNQLPYGVIMKVLLRTASVRKGADWNERRSAAHLARLFVDPRPHQRGEGHSAALPQWLQRYNWHRPH